jgi:2,4-dienoyl-CoA reductase (NADPH2)
LTELIVVRLTQHTIETPYMVGPVHCYTADVAGELILFDTGPPTPDAKRYLGEHIDLGRLRHVIITHCHIDHYGLASWLEQNSDATIYLTYRDCLKIEQHESRVDGIFSLLRDYGFSGQTLAAIRKVFESGGLFPPFPRQYKVAERDIPEHLGIDVLSCPGHSQSDLVYLIGDSAVTGDTLLKGIFQCPLLDIDLEKGDRFNNYEAYCTTLVKLAGLKGKKILPGHCGSINSVRETLTDYVQKLLQRARQLRPYREVADLPYVIEKLFEDRMSDVFHSYLKASEIVFMQDFLARPELLREALEKTGLYKNCEVLYQQAIDQCH